jgi:hypothetical protein
MAIADRVTLGGMEFENVVFGVFPDASLTFAGGAYSIEAIIGLPVLMELGRIEIREQGGTGGLRYGPSPSDRTEAPNLLLNGLNPLVLVTAAAAEGPLLMTLDTGARTTQLTPHAAEAYPRLVADARTETGTIAGVGGERRDEIQIIPRLDLSVDGFDIALRDVRLAAFARDARHGVLGQDVLRAGGGYALDFEALRFEILPP